MIVTEARRTRNLLIRLDRGEELPVALLRALGEAEARAAWITGMGTVEAAEIVLYDQQRRELDRTRRIDTPSGIISLTGNAALADGALSLHLSVTLARETDVGLQLLAGQLIWARAFSVELSVLAFDDVALLRSFDERTGLLSLTARQAAAASLAAEPPRASSFAEPQRTLAAAHRAADGPAAAQQYPPATPAAEAPAMPQKPVRIREDVDAYPEVGDAVEHFHFGECTVIGSDGDRIRLRQERDGRVREVALSMLRTEEPTVIDGKRHFKLARKN
jgi:predicted DNA-binding protein with PD1-like motif